MKSKKDVEYKDWNLPLLNDKNGGNNLITNKCVGKNVTDAVEALTCALYLSTNCLRTVLDWISQIKLVPINLTGDFIEKFSYKVDYTLRLYKPLNLY